MIRRFRSFLMLIVLLVVASQAWATTKSLVVARLYGSGGGAATGPKYDYVELFNGGPTAVNLKYFTLQYQGGTSATGFGSSALVTLPDYVLQPGQYFLIQFIPQTAPTTGVDLTLTPDYTWPWSNTTDYSSSNGKLAIVFGNTLLPACAVSGVVTSPPPSSPNLVDFFAYGNGTNGSTIVSNCAEGSAPGPNGSSTRAQYRTNVCADTDNNGADITTDNGTSSNDAAVQPKHNSATTPTPCYTGTTVLPSNTPANVPLTALDNVPLTITAQAANGSNPASTSLHAVADLTAFGGSATQALYDDGTNGDAVAGDNKFTYTFTVPAAQPSGSVTVPVSVFDDFYRFNTKNLTIGVGGALPPTVAIHSVQAAVPSAYNGQQVTVQGIVTAVTSSGFYLQAADADADADPSTSEAIFVSATTLPSGVAKGAQFYVTGTVSNNGYVNTLGGALTTLEVATSVTLPTAITISSADQDTTAAPANLRRLEGMRVTAATLTTVSGTGGTVGGDGSVTSNDNFYAVFSDVARPFREAGALYTDVLPASAPSTVTRFDGNLERLLISALPIYGKTIDITAQASLTGVTGILEFASGSPAIELSAYPTTITGQLGYPAALAAGGDTKFTVASVNFDDLYNATQDGTEPVVLSAANYAARLAKASTQIRSELNSPDVVAVQNVENLTTLQDIVNKISADATAASAADPGYVPYLQTGTDSTALNTGFLVRPLRATVSSVTQAAQGAQYTNPATSTQAATFTHPPLVLSLAMKQAGGSTYPLTVINTLLTPYYGSAGAAATSGANVRAQREAQAEQVAQLVQSHQAAGEGVLVVGGFNSLQVPDGYVDVVGAIKGTPADPSTVVVASPSNIVATPLVDLGALVAQSSRYSHVQDGNAEAVDTVLISSSLATGSSAAYLHGDADYQEAQRVSATSPLRNGSHDFVLAYVAVPKLASALAVSITPNSLSFGSVPTASTTTQTVTIANTGSSSVLISSIAATGTGFSETHTCGASLATGKTCVVTVTFAPTSATTYTGSLTITDNAPDSPQIVALSGTGVVTTANANPTTLSFASTIAGNTSATQTVTVTNTGSATLALSSATFAAFPGTVTNNCASSVAAGSTCTVVVAYAPTTAGTNTGTLTLSGNIPSPLVINLSGTAAAAIPQAVLTPSTVDFGNQTVSVASSTMVVTLSNPGTGTLTGIATSITGDFTRTTTCGTTLAVNANCTITITFTPTATGARTGTLSVADNATGSPQTVPLSGTGVPPAPIVTLTPASLTFGNTLINTTSATQTVTVKNTGSATLTFTAIAPSANFTVTGGTCSTASSIAVNGTCTVIVAFAPTSGGTLPGTVTLTDNAASGSQTIGLTGNGIDFTLTAPAGGNAVTVTGGQAATYSITLTPQNFSGTVTLACAGTLPTYSNCTAPATVTLVAGTPQTITLSVNTFAQTLAEVEPAGQGVSLALGVAGMLLAGLSRKRKRMVRLLALMLFSVGLSMGLAGCSVTQKQTTSKNPYATTPGTYSFSLTATSGTITHSLPLTLTVK